MRELCVYSEIVPFDFPISEIIARRPRGIILSGGPDSVFRPGAPRCDAALFALELPVLGICYGAQLLSACLGGTVRPAEKREYGKAELSLKAESLLFRALPERMQVWMSHGDVVERPPADFKVVGVSGGLVAAVESSSRKIFGLQFHPEVTHTPFGREILRNFLFEVCRCSGDWTMRSFAAQAVEQIRSLLGGGRAICALSGGVDSAVAAILVHRAAGDRLTAIFVDNGLLRLGEFERVLETFKNKLHLNVVGVRAGERFLARLRRVEDPELKRKAIGEEFIRLFEEEARKLGEVEFLVQGTLYPDVIESRPVKGPSSVIKSHHNVGGLPEKMHLKLIEPLRELFKDEVRRLGRELGLDEEFITRQPFPGPGLAVRIIGEVTEERLELLRRADAIVEEEMRRAGLYHNLWQSFALLLPVKSVGVMGDDRTYENVVALRAVESEDGMTADWARLPYQVLETISNRIVNEVRGINRVVYDISSKPPSTIEWE